MLEVDIKAGFESVEIFHDRNCSQIIMWRLMFARLDVMTNVDGCQ